MLFAVIVVSNLRERRFVAEWYRFVTASIDIKMFNHLGGMYLVGCCTITHERQGEVTHDNNR